MSTINSIMDCENEDNKQASFDKYNPTINIAIIGAVSTGKSTLMNALFVEQYSDTNIKRTTAVPQVYIEVNKINITEDDIKKIREQNKNINNQIMDATIKGLELKEIKELHYIVPKIYDMFDLAKGTCLSIYDLPGLNDSMTKNIYHDYIRQNFYKFNIIIFVVDVFSALNTSDEIDILNLILNGIKKNKEMYGYNTNLIVLVNKCDELIEQNGELIPQDEELQEMYEQIKTVIDIKIKNIMPNITKFIVCASCEDCYIYRMYKKNPEIKLDIKYINKLGSNELGPKVWNKFGLSENNKRKKIFELLKDFDYNERIEQCGFSKFKAILQKCLCLNNQLIFLTSHIHYSLLKLVDSVSGSNDCNLTHIISIIRDYKKTLIKINERYCISSEDGIIKMYCSLFIKNYEKNQFNYINDEKIINNDDYAKVKMIKAVLELYIDVLDNYDIFVKNNIEMMDKKLCNYLIEQLHSINSKSYIIKICNEFKNNKYNLRKLNKLINVTKINLFKNIIEINNEFLKYIKIMGSLKEIDHIKLIFNAHAILIELINKFVDTFNLSNEDKLNLIIYNLIALQHSDNKILNVHSIISYNLQNYLIISSNPHKLMINLWIDFFKPKGDNIMEDYILMQKVHKIKEKMIDEFFIETFKEIYSNDIININDIITTNITNN
jgi:predicted GTPase